MQETPFDSWVNKIHWRRARLPTLVFLGFSGGSVGKESTCQYKRCKFDPWVRKIPWKRNGNPLQDSCLENSMDRGTWQAIALGVTTCLIYGQFIFENF